MFNIQLKYIYNKFPIVVTVRNKNYFKLTHLESIKNCILKDNKKLALYKFIKIPTIKVPVIKVICNDIIIKVKDITVFNNFNMLNFIKYKLSVKLNILYIQ